MRKYFEIRWHGRGGQGAKTAALLFGEAAMYTGKYIQAFPEYGPERTGAPVQAFNRLSDENIRIHTRVKHPDIVVVLDSSLMEAVNVLEGLKDDGIILVNSQDTPQHIREKYSIPESIKVATVDATGIALNFIKRNVPNTPMLGAMIKVSGVLDFNEMMKSIEKKLNEKFRGRKDVIEGNLKSIKKAFEEVVS